MTAIATKEPDLYSRHVGICFEAMPSDFRTGLRELVRHVADKGGLPSPSTVTPSGYRVGRWYARTIDCPHILTIEQRAALLTIPGVAFTPPRGARVAFDPPTEARATLWQRLQVWADDPMADAICRRFIHGRAARRAAAARGPKKAEV